MYFPGHVALSYLSSQYLWANLKVAMIAGLFPDVVDKVAYYVLKITPSAHVPAHTLAALIGTSLLVGLFGIGFGAFWMFAYSWALAYGLHLIFDHLNGKLYLLWPLVDYPFSPYQSIQENWSNAALFWVGVTVVVELGLTGWAVWVWGRKKGAQ